MRSFKPILVGVTGVLACAEGAPLRDSASGLSATAPSTFPSLPDLPQEHDSTTTGAPTTSPSSDGTTCCTDIPTTTSGSHVDPDVPPPTCGNGKVEGSEACDLNAFDGMTCMTLGYDQGPLFCNMDCTVDKSMCSFAPSTPPRDPTCENGIIEMGEECDCGVVVCQVEQFGMKTCSSLGYAGGLLTCTDCFVNHDLCVKAICGNGKIEALEECDGQEFQGTTCSSLGYKAGSLSCTQDCTIDVSMCEAENAGPICGDGICDVTEDSCSCAPDCPDDPNTCMPCECGTKPGPCSCIPGCEQFFDCCANAPSVCP